MIEWCMKVSQSDGDDDDELSDDDDDDNVFISNEGMHACKSRLRHKSLKIKAVAMLKASCILWPTNSFELMQCAVIKGIYPLFTPLYTGQPVNWA